MRAAHRPMPAQAPLIAAMIGFGIVVGNQMGLSRPTAPGSSESAPPWRLSMSAPAHQPRPAPVTTMTRTSGSAAASSNNE